MSAKPKTTGVGCVFHSIGGKNSLNRWKGGVLFWRQEVGGGGGRELHKRQDYGGRGEGSLLNRDSLGRLPLLLTGSPLYLKGN